MLSTPAWGGGRAHIPHHFGDARAHFPHRFGAARAHFPHHFGDARARFPHHFGDARARFPHHFGDARAHFPHNFGDARAHFHIILGMQGSICTFSTPVFRASLGMQARISTTVWAGLSSAHFWDHFWDARSHDSMGPGGHFAYKFRDAIAHFLS